MNMNNEKMQSTNEFQSLADRDQQRSLVDITRLDLYLLFAMNKHRDGLLELISSMICFPVSLTGMEFACD